MTSMTLRRDANRGRRSPVPAAGSDPGQRRLNGLQRSGREYRNLSEAEFAIDRTNAVDIAVRDGTRLRADIFRPSSGRATTRESVDGSVPTSAAIRKAPALLSFSCYPRQIQDLGAPLGFVEAGASDFFVPRGYTHVIVNARGTGGSAGTFGLGDTQEREDVCDVIEWIAAQDWSDGQIGGLGISYYAMPQLWAAAARSPHLKAIFPFATLDDLYNAVWHGGVLNARFFGSWMSAIGIMAGISDQRWRSRAVDLARRVLNAPFVHARMEHVNGEVAANVMREVMRTHYAEEPFGRLWQEAAVEHPTHDWWWDARNIRDELGNIDIPVYLGCQWDNVPVHLPSTFPVYEALSENPNVRMTLVDKGALAWPWESMHEEALAWYDHWLKGNDTGITDGPPIRYVIPGTDQWRTTDAWPPSESSLTAYVLQADGLLTTDGDTTGSRDYLYLPAGSGRPRNANPPTLPDRLVWCTTPADDPLDIVGDIELELDASITALDTAWIVTLSVLAPDDTITPVTAGWLRAQLRTLDEHHSRPGRPVPTRRDPVAIPVGEVVRYRIPLVPNARRIPAGHRVQLVLANQDDGKDGPAMLGFTHTSVSQASRNTVLATSRLLLPVLAE